MISKKLRVIAGVQMLVLAMFVSSLGASLDCFPQDRKCEGCEEEYVGFWQDDEGFWRHWWFFGYYGYECDASHSYSFAEPFGEVTWHYEDYEQICWLAEFDCAQWEGGV